MSTGQKETNLNRFRHLSLHRNMLSKKQVKVECKGPSFPNFWKRPFGGTLRSSPSCSKMHLKLATRGQSTSDTLTKFN